jgi:hypothetical protein
MGKFSRDKGARGEREVAQIFRAFGFDCRRTGEYVRDDLIVCIDGHERVIEVKCRKRGLGPGDQYKALGEGIMAVVHKADRMPWLITMDLLLFLNRLAPLPSEKEAAEKSGEEAA